MVIKIKSSGKSMFPLIFSGDTIEVDTYFNFTNITVGDIVVFSLAGKLVAHRVVKKMISKSTFCFKTKGDYNSFVDYDLLTINNYIGKAIQVVNIQNNYKLQSQRFRLFNFLFLFYSRIMMFKLCHAILNKVLHNFSFYLFFSLFFGRNRKVDKGKYNSQYIHHLLILQSTDKIDAECSWDFSLYDIDTDQIPVDILFNKTTFLSNHILTCSNCKKNYSQAQITILYSLAKKLIVGQFFMEKSIADVQALFRSYKNDFIFLKLFKPKVAAQKISADVFNSVFNSSGNDLDILVKKDKLMRLVFILLFKKYKIEYVFNSLELLLRNETIPVDLDIHFYSLLPRENIFNKEKVKLLTEDLFINQKDNMIPFEYIFFTKVARYWTNDLHRVLKGIYEIAVLSHLATENDWKKIKFLSTKYDFTNELLLTLFVSQNLFNFAIVPTKIFQVSFFQYVKIKAAAKKFDLQMITNLSDIKMWWDENNLSTMSFLLDLHLARIFINKSLLYSLTKPRILLFLLGIKF